MTLQPFFPVRGENYAAHHRTAASYYPTNGADRQRFLLVAFILSVIKAIVLFKVITFQAIIWIAAVLILLKTIGLLIFWVLLVMAIMSWVSEVVARLNMY